MPLPSARRIHRLTHRVIATAVALSLLSMPVTYRGGADAAHAHTVFQLWEDVRIGSFTHHTADDEADRPHHEVTGGEHGTIDHVVMGDGDQDAPVAGSAFTPSVRGTILALPLAPALLVSESFSARVRQSVRLDGLTDSPTPPPPRRAA